MRVIYAVVELSMHTGQIIQFAKLWKGDLQLYDCHKAHRGPTWPRGAAGH